LGAGAKAADPGAGGLQARIGGLVDLIGRLLMAFFWGQHKQVDLEDKGGYVLKSYLIQASL